MLSGLASLLPEQQKQQIKSLVGRAQAAYVKRFLSYDSQQLLAALRTLGIAPGDVVMVHSAYSALNGFRGPPGQIVLALQQAVAPGGTLLMPSSPFTGVVEDYLNKGEAFDVLTTPSRMGIISELFRRARGTKRSLQPTHPVLANGPLAQWFVDGHEDSEFAFGLGSPFAKLVEKDAKALFFDVGFMYLMFFHYLEHLVHEALPEPLYDPQTYQVTVIDTQRQERTMSVRSFAKRARAARRFEMLEPELIRRGSLRSQRLGNTRLAVVQLRDIVALTQEWARAGKYFYDFGNTR